jgi:branched-chain amino acid transport system permease protein
MAVHSQRAVQVLTTLGVGIVALACTPLVTGYQDFSLVILVLIYALAGAGTDLLVGVAGQASIGTAAIMAVSGYSIGLAGSLQSSFWLAALVGMLSAAAAGCLVGLPSLRIGGMYLAVGTLALQFLVFDGGDQLETSSGHLGGYPIKIASFFPGVRLESNLSWYVSTVLVVLVGMLGVLFVRYSRFGRACIAIRENEDFARSFGIDVGRVKLGAFIVSSVPIGLAGVLLAYQNGNVDFNTYSLTFAILFIGIVAVGGIGSITGSFLGAVVFVAGPKMLQSVFSGLSVGAGGPSTKFILSSGLIGAIIFMTLRFGPSGLAGIRWAGARRAVGGAGRVARREYANRETPTPAQPGGGAPLPAAGGLGQVVVSKSVCAEGAAPNRRSLRVRGAQRTAPRAQPSSTALSVAGLHVEYRGGARAVNGVSFELERGESLAIVGTNGAGKTSLVRAIAGLGGFVGAKVTAGEVLIDGVEATHMAPWKRVHLGLQIVPERTSVFPSLTVAAHTELAKVDPSGLYGLPPEVRDLLLPHLARRAGDLSGGQRQLLAILSAVLQRPRLLVVDECSLGLSPAAIRLVVETIAWARDTFDLSLVVVEQNIGVAQQLANRALVLSEGAIGWSGASGDLGIESAVSDYLGSTHK